MNPIKSLLAALTLVALALSLPLNANAAGGKGNQRGGKAAEHMSDKGSFNTNAQWSADPDRGWVRADERHKLHEKKGESSNVDRHEGKAKGRGKAKGF
jgi:hypothetical protein